MNKYKYQVVYTTKFKKSLKKMLKQNKNIEELLDIVDKLAIKEKLEKKYKMTFPFGAGSKVDEFSVKFIEKYGKEEFDKLVKRNFANYKKVLDK